MRRTPAISFLVIGIVFFTLGASGRRGFTAVGVAFLAIGIAFLVRQRRG